MDTRTGKKVRMGRIFNQDSGRTLIVAYSHGVIMGPLDGMRTLDEMQSITKAISKVDALMVAPGMLPQLEDVFIGKDAPALFVHMDYQSYSRKVIPYDVGGTVALGKAEQALTAGADAVMMYMYIGHEDPELEKLEIQRNALMARECEKLGLVLMIEALSAREKTHPEDKQDPDVLSLSCRIAAELGADIVKCQHPGSAEALAKIVETCPVPLLQAGGAKTPDPEDAFAMAHEAMSAGSSGLVFGRNIFGADDPTQTVQRYREIIHGKPINSF